MKIKSVKNKKIIFELNNEIGLIIAEGSGTLHDAEIEIAWLNLRLRCTWYIQATIISAQIEVLNIRAKNIMILGCS
ncbi:MAG: hypothetical protein QG673_1442 [Pseudomonadota bacterium]|nr:hypothetical protein [Pseudomonadota bacterium]